MKKFTFLALILLVGWSCQKDQEQLTPVDPVPETEKSYVVPIEEALKSLEVALDRIDGETTRVGGRRTVKSIERIKAARVLRAATRVSGDQPAIEDLFYIVSFGEGQGSAVLGADKRLESIYAILDETVLTAEVFDLPTATRSELPADGDSIRYVSSEEELTDFVAGMIVNAVIFPPTVPDPDPGVPEVPKLPTYYYQVDTTVTINVQRSPCLNTKWGHRDPFNMYTPFETDGKIHRAVGCVAVAVGQFLNYHSWPTPNTIEGETFDWSLIQGYTHNATPSSAVVDEVARYLYALGRALNTTYDSTDNKSSSSLSYLPSLLSTLGVSSNAIYRSYDKEIAQSLVEDKGLFCMRGVTSSNEGHAWIVDGWYDYTTVITRKQIQNITGIVLSSEVLSNYRTPLMHCNFGWEGTADGYYSTYAINFDTTTLRTGILIDEFVGDVAETMTANFVQYFEMVSY